MEKIFLTKSPLQTRKLGEKIAQQLIKKGLQKKALILALKGELGGGKTTFLKGFAKGLKIKEKILSSSFIIMRKSKICANLCSNSCKFANFYHIDCYRIENPNEILDLGFKKIIKDPKNILAIEWADKIEKILPKTIFWINFSIKGKKKRQISIKF